MGGKVEKGPTNFPSLCGCCENCFPSCMMSYCCYPVMAAQVGSRAGYYPSACGGHEPFVVEGGFRRLLILFSTVVASYMVTLFLYYALSFFQVMGFDDDDNHVYLWLHFC